MQIEILPYWVLNPIGFVSRSCTKWLEFKFIKIIFHLNHLNKYVKKYIKLKSYFKRLTLKVVFATLNPNWWSLHWNGIYLPNANIKILKLTRITENVTLIDDHEGDHGTWKSEMHHYFTSKNSKLNYFIIYNLWWPLTDWLGSIYPIQTPKSKN